MRISNCYIYAWASTKKAQKRLVWRFTYSNLSQSQSSREICKYCIVIFSYIIKWPIAYRTLVSIVCIKPNYFYSMDKSSFRFALDTPLRLSGELILLILYCHPCSKHVRTMHCNRLQPTFTTDMLSNIRLLKIILHWVILWFLITANKCIVNTAHFLWASRHRNIQAQQYF